MKKKKTVTLPRTFNPGNGHPTETLAYLSPAEHELIRKLTDGKWNRGPKGVKSYADESMASKGVTDAKSSGPKGNAGVGQGGQGSGSKAGPSPSGGVSTGGGLRGAGSNYGPGSGRPGSGAASGTGMRGAGSNTGPGSGRPGSSSAAKSTATGAGGLRGAGSNYGPGSGRPGGGAALGGAAKAAQNNASRAPNAAAQAAYDRQTMRAVSNRHDPVVRGAAPNPKGTFPGASPADFARTALGYNVNRMDQLGITDANRIVQGFNNLKQFADVAYDPAGVQKIKDRLGYTPVGIRANNPGNLLNSGWQKDIPGYTGPMTSPNGLTYASYSDPRWGLAAQNELLGRYSDMGRNTINSVVDRYAPVDQNNSAAANASYKQSLTNATGWGANDALTREQVQSLGPHKTAFENGGLAFTGGPFGGTSTFPSNVQVAGLANAPMAEADRLDRARKAADAASAVAQGFGQPATALPSDPRLSIPRGSFPAGPVQGPQRYSGPLDSIPQPASQGMFGAPSAFASDPRLNLPQGSFPAGPQIATDPRVSQAPLGALPPAREPAQIATDPRVALTPIGTLPAAPPKDIQLAWNVPPMGGAMTASPDAWKALGTFGSNRPRPTGPAATPGTIHSQTADAAPAAANTTGWSWDSLRQTASTKMAEAQKQIDEVKKTSGWKFAQEHPKLAAFGLKMMMGGGGKPNGAMGSPQDRADFHMPPPMPQQPQQMAQADQPEATPLQTLQGLLNNMIAKGATPDEIAYVQSLIEELSQRQVA